MEQDNGIMVKFLNEADSTKPCAFWFWEADAANMKDERIRHVMENNAKKLGYGGFSIVPNKLNDYLTEAYFDRYRVALETAKQLGLTMIIYDENGFPSGAANGLFGEKYPTHTVKRLDKLEWDFEGPGRRSICVGTQGTVMSAVLMNMQTKKRIDVSGALSDGTIQLTLEDGHWKLMVFLCVKEGSPMVDYLSYESVGKFIEMTHEAYYSEFYEYFGNVIRGFFYDEPSMWGFKGPWIPSGRIVTEGRLWTPGFNEYYQKLYGSNPACDYPALWYDIGEDTQGIRRRFFECRSEMFNENYMRQMADWCTAHNVFLTGHTWEENILNPAGTIGDLMKVFKHQHIPGIDSITEYQCVKSVAKIVSSSSDNWDKPLTMCETFGAMPEDESLRSIFFKEIMDLYAKGINYLVPHAVWYGPNAYISPNLSYGGPYTDILPEVTAYLERLNAQLQNSRHVADIAVVYPIEDMHAAFCFGRADDPCVPEYCNYTAIGEMLSCEIRADFTYLHPEILVGKCTVDAAAKTLRLDNERNFENYKVLIFPAMDMVPLSLMQKAEAFRACGGTVIFVERTPGTATNISQSDEVKRIVSSMLNGASAQEQRGGRAYFLNRLDKDSLRSVLKKEIPVWDVEIDPVQELHGGTLSYIHKVKDGKDIYFFANSSAERISTSVRLRESVSLTRRDPRTGRADHAATDWEESGKEKGTRFTLELPPESSMLYLSNEF